MGREINTLQVQISLPEFPDKVMTCFQNGSLQMPRHAATCWTIAGTDDGRPLSIEDGSRKINRTILPILWHFSSFHYVTMNKSPEQVEPRKRAAM